MRATRRGVSGWKLWSGVAVALSLACAASPSPAQDVATRGRDIVTKYSDAVVTVKLAMKMRMAMEGREQQEEESSSEITATVIDPATGLAVCALSEADPTSAVGQMMGDQPDFKFEMDITDVKIRLADGKELPAKVVLRDKDLDLAFVRPTEAPAKPLAAIDLSASAPTDVLEEVIILNRMAEVANRVPAAILDRTVGVIKKPRLMYVPGPVGQYANLGCPVFTLDGKVVGIIVNRFPPGAGGSREERSPLSVVMPAGDVSDIAKQAAAQKAEGQ